MLHGNLAPRSAVIKHSAASPGCSIPGEAVVFDSVEDMTARIDLPDLDVNTDDILVLRNAGPGGAGDAGGWLSAYSDEAGPPGRQRLVRISDARMSGTAFGTIVLHIVPESAVGGPLAVVRTGDQIMLDVEARGLNC